MNKTPLSGIGYLFQGLRLLNQPSIRLYVIIPLTINIILFGIGLWYGYSWFQEQLIWLDGFLPSWLHWLQWIILPLWIMVLVVVVFFSFSMVANLVASPFNALLAERVEHHLTGRFPQGEATGMTGMVASVVPLIWNEINKILYFILWAIPFLVLFVIPGVNVIASFIWIAFSAWMLSIEYVDIPMGNHNLSGKQVRSHLRSQRLLGLGFGGSVLLMTSVPFINFLAMPAAVAGATLLWVEQFKPKE